MRSASDYPGVTTACNYLIFNELFRDLLIINGTGHVDVELNYGPSEDGVSLSDSYPIKFVATIDIGTFHVTISEIDVDTSSFYE